MTSLLVAVVLFPVLGQVESLEGLNRRISSAAARAPSDVELRQMRGSELKVLPEFQKHVSNGAHLEKKEIADVRKKASSIRRVQNMRVPILQLSRLERNQVGILNRQDVFVRERELREMPGALLIKSRDQEFVLVGMDVSDKSQDGKNVHYDGWLRVNGLSDKISGVFVLEPFDSKVLSK